MKLLLSVALLLSLSANMFGGVAQIGQVHIDRLELKPVPRSGCVLEAVVTSQKTDHWAAGTYNIYACHTPDKTVKWCTQIATLGDIQVYSCMINWTPPQDQSDNK